MIKGLLYDYKNVTGNVKRQRHRHSRYHSLDMYAIGTVYGLESAIMIEQFQCTAKIVAAHAEEPQALLGYSLYHLSKERAMVPSGWPSK